MTAVLLALLTALCYGVANYLGPLLTRRHALGSVLLVGQVVGVLGGLLLLLVQRGHHPGVSGLLFGVGAGMVNGVALASFYRAASVGPISVVAPIGATGGVVPVLVAIATGERPAALQLVGIPLAVAGVVLAAARSARDARGPATLEDPLARVADPPPRSDGREQGSHAGLAVFSAVMFGTFLTLFAHASRSGTAWAVLTSRTALLVCTVVVLLVLRQPMTVPRAALPAVAVPGVLLLVGTAAYGAATSTGLVSVVSVLATLSPVVTVGLAVVVLGERLAGRQRAGVLAALVGVVLLAAG